MNDDERMATGFVECTTQYDYAPLPEPLKEVLLEAASALNRWIESQGVYRIETQRVAFEVER